MSTRDKRVLHRIGYSALDRAHDEGYDAWFRKTAINHYPPGKRHDAWNDAYWGRDVMGEHQGRNA